MTSQVPLERGRFIPLIFAMVNVAIGNLLFWLLISLYPEIKAPGAPLRELWVLVNVAELPWVFNMVMRRHEGRAITMDVVTRNVFVGVLFHAFVFLSLIAFLHISVIPTRAFFIYYVLLTIGGLLFQITAHYLLKAQRRRGFNFTRVVIVGTGATAQRLYAAMKRDSGYGYKVLGFFDDQPEGNPANLYKGTIADLDEFMNQHSVRQIFYTLSGQNESLAQVIKTADDHVADFYYVPQIPRTFSRPLQLHNIGPMPVLSMRRNPLKNTLNRIIKRTWDLLVSGIFLIFYPLIYIPVAIGIKLTSPGPVYFKQDRTGYLGKPFKCLKFRTMHVNANADKTQATKDDPRKTRFGDFLRRTSIDELPQFINVFRGDMSVVGPRPHMLKHTEDYSRLINAYMARHSVKPGITGWAQVNGYRGITDELWKMERRVECDVWYIENWTFLLDLKIMVRTVINVFAGEKNAF